MNIRPTKTPNTISLCEKFDVPKDTSYEKIQSLLEQRFDISKKLYFPDWDQSWWDTHIPSFEEETMTVEWYTHMPKEFLVTSPM
jgi:hypothetical protein